MPFTYVVDTDTTTHIDPSTFGTFSEVFSHVLSTHGVYLTTGGDAGLVTILFRNSTGVPLVEEYSINSFAPNGAPNSIEVVGEFSNGHPAILTPPAVTQSGSCFKVYDDNITLRGSEEDAFIIRGNAANTDEVILLDVGKSMSLLSNIVIDGLGDSGYAGVSGTGTVTLTNSKIIGCNLAYYGACRGANISLDHCTVVDCALLRTSNTITNSLFVNVPSFYDGLVQTCDYNAYDVDKNSLNYGTGVDTAAVDVNSIFSLDLNTNLAPDSVGAYDITLSSILINADSSGTGNIGANTDILASDPPESGNTTISVAYNSTQVVDISLIATDDTGIDWDSLVIISPAAHGTTTKGVNTITVDYTGTGYVGADELRYRVSDVDGIVSDDGVVSIAVNALPSTMTLQGVNISRGQSFTLNMSGYTAGASIGYVEVHIKDVAGDGTEYPCEVISNADTSIVCMAPDTNSMPPMSGAQLIVTPIDSY